MNVQKLEKDVIEKAQIKAFPRFTNFLISDLHNQVKTFTVRTSGFFTTCHFDFREM